MEQQYNTKCAGVKRLMKEAMELREPTELYHAQPLEDNLFEWHFTVRGATESHYEGGIYHGRLLFPPEYPMKPPNMILLTPNGRFELNTKICLSISGYHPETWLPSWSVRTCLIAIIGFMPTAGGGALGSLEYPEKERKKLAKLSVNWKCEKCQSTMKEILLPFTENTNSSKVNEEAKLLGAQLNAQKPKEVKPEEKVTEPVTIITQSQQEIESNNGDSSPRKENNEVGTSQSTSEEIVPPAENNDSSPEGSGTTQITYVTESDTPRSRGASTSSFRAAPLNRANTDSCDYSLFIIVPCVTVAIAILVLLVTRRILMVTNSIQ